MSNASSANDTKIYDHAKISDLNNCRNTIYQSISKREQCVIRSNASSANDTKIYDHAKISDLNNCRNTIYQSISKLSV